MKNCIPKVIKLEGRGFRGMIVFVDSQIDRGLSLRKISKSVQSEFNVSISHESIRIYKFFRQGKPLKDNWGA